VNWYVFFKRWLIPSLLPTVFNHLTLSFHWHLKNFSIQSGLFPFRLVNLCADSPYYTYNIKHWTQFEILPASTIITIFATFLKNMYYSTYIDFAENQLSQSLISLSPLITTHPRILLTSTGSASSIDLYM